VSAVVAHHLWDRPGGGLVMAGIAAAVEKMGLTPVLTSLTRFDGSKYREWFGIDLSKYPAVSGGFSLRMFGLYMRLLVWWPAEKAVKKYRPKFVVIDMPTYRRLVGKVPVVEYIHFPLDATFNPRYRHVGFYYTDDPYAAERYGRFPMNLYAKVFTHLYPHFARDNPFTAAALVLTNSRWTAEVVKKIFGEEPEVLNPPLPPNVEVVERPRPFGEREPVVVMLGRFSQEKRYHWVVREVAPRLVKEVPGARLVIFGGAATPTLQAYYRRVWRLAEEAGLKVADSLDAKADVYLVANAPRRVINEVMDRARAFFHATINEHWGIAVAEAMARGLPVVVHKSGGAWTDLAEEGRYGLGYETAEEAVEALARLLLQGAKFDTTEKARELTYPKFREKLAKVLGL
jgi:alpha-1,2-mannosyltransferase